MRKNQQLPRIVLVTRKTPLELLLERHGTLGQAKFYLQSRGEDIGEAEAIQERFGSALNRILQAIPTDRRRTRIERAELDRFLFAPDDVVVIVGQDGLVPNAAKYLRGQVTVGVNPDPDRYDGVLCRHRPESFEPVMDWLNRRTETEEYCIQRRVMAVAQREDGQRILALNEVYIGHRSHQTSRYRIRVATREERQFSSGVICSTGTGCTGWARSIVEQRALHVELPQPETPCLAWFVREPFPSVYTGTTLNFGLLRNGQNLQFVSEMGEGGVVFADGIEGDNIEFLSGQSLRVGVSDVPLRLVVPGGDAKVEKKPSSPSLARRAARRSLERQPH